MDEQTAEKENDPSRGTVAIVGDSEANGKIAASRVDQSERPEAAASPLLLAEGTGEEAGTLEALGAMQDEAYALEKQIDETEKRMRMHESNTRYVEAERERRKLEQLKRRRKSLTQRHVERYQRVDAQQLQSFARDKQKTFDERWEKAFVAHSQKTRNLYHLLKDRHNGELTKLKVELEKKEKERHPKSSSGLLELRTKQRALARCQRYVEAENIRKTADALEMKEFQGHVSESQRQNQVNVEMMLNQHRVEMNALRQKTKLERKVMMEDRNKEQEQLDNRLRNSFSEMTRMHTKQALVAEGKLFDTGFYTQRGAARSSIPLAAGHLLTGSSTRSGGAGTESQALVSQASEPAAGAREPLPAILSAEQQKQEQDREAGTAGIRCGSDSPKASKSPVHDLYAQGAIRKSRKGGSTGKPSSCDNKKENFAGNGNGAAPGKIGERKTHRAPGRRRKEFSIRNLSRDKKQVRS